MMRSYPPISTSSVHPNARRAVSILFFLAIAAFAGVYYYRHPQMFELMTRISPGAVAALVPIHFGLMLCHGWQVKLLTQHRGLDLSFHQWFGISRLTAFLNLFLPYTGGTAVKAWYLKRFHRFDYSAFISTTTASVLIRILLFSLVAMIALTGSGRGIHWLNFICLAVFTGCLGILKTGPFLRMRMSSRCAYLATLMDAWQNTRSDTGLLRRLVVLNGFVLLFLSAEIYVSFLIFHHHPSLTACVLIAALSAMVWFFNLIPANLGVKEVVFIALAAFYGTDVNVGLHAAAFNRIFSILVLCATAPGFLHSLKKSAANPIAQPE